MPRAPAHARSLCNSPRRSVGAPKTYKKYNEGHVPDIVQPGASAWGTDWIGETKVPSPLGAAPAKDQCEHVGHL